ncbi:protease modulator HflC [Alkalimarinus coralli]|uniref:protease modulator HflC n=1 Tax=Alkalimarinus coralli TaxID=2935863 RepID=UPI00202B8FEA|nr:protease modulator HflC [Alkalimarinus coralli]
MSPKAIGILFVALIVLVIGSSAIYVVPETQSAVRLRFGELVENEIQPGLHFKAPLIDEVRKFDVRILTLDVPERQYLTIEQKPLVVDSFVTWQVGDVAKYYKSTSGDETRAVMLLSSRIDNGLRDQFGIRTMHEVISGQRDELMHELTKAMNAVMTKEFGISIVDIRIKGIDLPQKVSSDVYRRMRTEREKEAQEHRSKGRELAEGIKADADRQKTIVEAEAYRESEVTRGEGDEIAAQIYADAYNKNAEFYSFYRSLLAYEDAFSNKGDVLVVDPESDFLKYLKQSQGQKK